MPSDNPLIEAVFRDNVETLRNLVDQSDSGFASIDIKSVRLNNLSLAHLAIINNRPKVLEYLLRACFSTELEDDDGDSLLMYAVGTDNPRADACIDVLLKYRANVFHRNKKNTTPLMAAAFMDNLYAIRRLLEHGANVADHDNLGGSAIYYAVNNVNRRFRGVSMPTRSTILYLLEAGAPIDDLYHANCILSVQDAYGAPLLIPKSSYKKSLLDRDDLNLMVVNPNDKSLIQNLLSN